MTIAALTEGRVQILGDGLTDRVDLPFQFVDQNDLQVIHSDAGGTETEWIYQQSPGNWNFTGGDYTAGTVQFSASDLAAGERLTVVLVSKFDQPLTLAGGEIDPAVLERAMDRTALKVQAIAGRVNRSLSVAPSLEGELPDLQVPDLPDGYGFVRQGDKLMPALIDSTAISAAVSAAQEAKAAAEAERTGAEVAKTGSETARLAAVSAHAGAVTAQAASETARTEAETAATNAVQAAAEATTNATAVLGYGRVPVGFMIPWHGLAAPNQYWVLVDTVGQVFSRSLFPQLLDVFAPEFSVTFANGNPVVTGIDCSQKLKPGWAVEGENISAGTKILTVDGPTQITLTNNPTGDGTAIRVFPHGNGDGVNTANYPSVAGRVIRGQDSTGALNADAGNYLGETQEDALQNITGSWFRNSSGRIERVVNEAKGAMEVITDLRSVALNESGSSNANSVIGVSFDASRVARTAEETRVKAIIAPYIVKVADGADDPAIIAPANVVSDLAAVQTALATAQADITTLQSNMPTFAEFEFTSWANGVWYSMAHGVGSRPSVVFLYAECINANNGFIVGERTMLGMQDRSNNDGSAYNYGAGVSADESAVHWAGGAQSMRIMPRTNGGTVGVSPSDFKVVVVAGWL